MVRFGSAALKRLRPLRAIAAGISLSFCILVSLPLAPSGATPTHSHPAKTEHGHSTPVSTVVPSVGAATTTAGTTVEGAAAVAPVTGASTTGGAVRVSAKRGTTKHSAGTTKRRRGHTPAASGKVSTGAGRSGAGASVSIGVGPAAKSKP